MKLGIIGFGGRINSMVNTLLKAEPQLAIVGLLDTDPEAALARVPEKDRASVRVFQTIGELVGATRPDALAIGTRCDSHARLAIEASAFGLPLFLEKPVATRMEDALALEEAFRSNPCPVLVSFPLRASQVCQQAKGMLDLNTAGRIEHLLAVNYVPYGKTYFDMWYRDYSVTQGLFIQKATHDFDYLAFLAGAPITRVAAMSSCGRVHQDASCKPNPPDPDVHYYEGIGFPETGMNEDSSSALLEFANGAKGVYTQVFFSKRGAKRGAVVSGLHGMVEFDFYTGEIRGTRHREPVNTLVTIEGKEAHFGGDALLAENFLAMIREGAPSLAPLRTGLQSVYACLAAKASAELGEFIDVRQVSLPEANAIS
jgi:predicted dehydrogenase